MKKIVEKIEELFKNSYLKAGAILIIGILIGWLLFGGGGSSAPATTEEGVVAESEKKTIWTCYMHPQIRQDEPGLCPLCGMELTPLAESEDSDEFIDPSAIILSKEAVALANIQTTVVSKERPIKQLSLYGKVQIDERLAKSQTSHVSGRIEHLNINFTGERVAEGQTIATIYSPELLSAQQELIEAKRLFDQQPALLEAARQKLRLWKLTNQQIEQIESSEEVSALIDISANTGGVVVEKLVNEGDYIEPGEKLFKIANLSQLWVLFDAFESDLPFLNVDDNLEFTLQALPGKSFSGRISFVDPILDATTRTAKVRVVVPNRGGELKPEMYATAELEAPLSRGSKEQIVVPKSAVMWTGKRSIVYVRQDTEATAFMMREVELGASLGDSYVVVDGIVDGEEIATNGVFTIDASAQLAAKPSMMNQHLVEEQTAHSDGELKKGEEHTMIADVQGACEMCQERIEKAAMSVAGVSMAHWDIESKELHLNYNPKLASLDDISKRIAEVGHDVGTRFIANDEVYNALPDCCHYRE